jgi:hypothetical protein
MDIVFLQWYKTSQHWCGLMFDDSSNIWVTTNGFDFNSISLILTLTFI